MLGLIDFVDLALFTATAPKKRRSIENQHASQGF
jgi:hypothetical protein